MKIPTFCALAIVLGSTTVSAQATEPGRFGVSVEGLMVWQQRNDVRIPPKTGTPFSIVDLIGSAGTPSVRTEATVALNDRQELRFVHAPLRVTGQGTATAPISFADGLFQIGRAHV